MTQYLMFAENIYNKIKDEELFSHDCIENMNLLMTGFVAQRFKS
ncbi:hypothetical protein [Acinetobacter baumannii]